MASFDLPAFSAALDACRRTRGLTWRQVAEQSGTTQSLYSRLNKGEGRYPDVANLVAMSAWADLCLDDFVIGRIERQRYAQEQVLALVLADPTLRVHEREFLADVITRYYATTAQS